MAGIGYFQKNLKDIKPDSVLRLLADLVLKNLDNIRDFSDKEEFHKDDLIYKYNDTTKKHELLKCIVKKTKGAFNESDWEVYSIASGSGGSGGGMISVLEGSFTSTADGTVNCLLNMSKFNPELGYLLVSHSTYGLLKHSQYTLNTNGTSIDLVGLTLEKGETLNYYGIQNAIDEENIYNNFIYKERVEEVLNDTNKISINIPEFNPYLDSLIVFENTTLLNKDIHYTLNTSDLTINKISGNWLGGKTSITFWMFKNSSKSAPEYDGYYIKNDTVDDTKLGSKNKIGDITTLPTTNKTNVVNSLKEVYNDVIGSKDTLLTENKTNIVSSINEIVDSLKNVESTSINLNFGFNKIINSSGHSITPKINFKGVSYVNLASPGGRCEDISKFTIVNSTLELDSTNRVFGNYGIKITLQSAYTVNFLNLFPLMSSTKYYMASAYVKNGNAATGIRVQTATNGTGYVVKYSNSITDTTKFTRVCARLQPSDWGTGSTESYITVRVDGNVGEYAYMDGLMLQEISAADYALSDAELLAKYPYVESYGCTQNLMLENRRGNLVRNGNCEEGIGYWTPYATGITASIVNGKIQVNNTNGGPQNVYQTINVKPNTNYYLNGNASVVSGTSASILVTDATGLIFAFTGPGAFNVGSLTQIQVRLRCTERTIANFDSIMLIEGTTAPSSYIPCDRQVAVIEGMFTSDDTVKIDNGQVSGLLNWKHKTLFGKDYPWLFHADLTGFKRVYLNTPFLNTVPSTIFPPVCVRYDGKIMLPHLPESADSQWFDSSSPSNYFLDIADTDSGWTESINPNNNEIKAFMNGWKIYCISGGKYLAWKNIIDGSFPPTQVTTTTASAYAAGSTTMVVTDASKYAAGDSLLVDGYGIVIIGSISSNTLTLSSTCGIEIPSGTRVIRIDYNSDSRNLTYCMNNVAPNYEGYQLHYKLANPEPITDENVHVEGNLWNIEPGDNYIFVDTGIVLREVANSYLYTNYNLNIADGQLGAYGYTFKNKVEQFNAVYKNGNYDSSPWIYTSDIYAYGKMRAYLPTANFDTNATYTVDYKILATIAPQAITSLTASYAQDIFTAISGLSEEVEQKQQKDSALDRIVDLSMYQEMKTVAWLDRPAVVGANWGIQFYMTIPIAPMKTVPITSIGNVTMAYFGNDDNQRSIPKSDIRIFTIRVLGSLVNIDIRYMGSDSTIKSNLINYGGVITLDIKLDCRGRV